MKQRTYPIGSVSHGTMRTEDLIPTFLTELRNQVRTPGNDRLRRKQHFQLIRDIERRMKGESYEDSKMVTAGQSGRESFADEDLGDLFDALREYAGPYFYFGAHPGDGSDYGYWLSESWDEEFIAVPNYSPAEHFNHHEKNDYPDKIKVCDLSEIPTWFRGEVAVVTDHGNVTLYVKTARKLKEIWSIV
jgi:hypothetical protein